MSPVRLRYCLLFALAAGCAPSAVAPNADAGDDAGADAGADAGGSVATCGDGVTDAPETCDDGNNHSGDGCSGDCRIEACGNGRIDAREVCDGSPGCAPTCDAVTTCGNGSVEVGEQCDVGDVVPWDGCSASCEVERAVVLSHLELLTTGPCDLNGDGFGDSALGASLELAWAQVGTIVNDVLARAPFNVLVVSGVSDPTFTMDDPDLRLGWVRAADANGADPNFDGTGQVRVQPASLSMGQPSLTLSASLRSGLLEAGPEDVLIPFFGSFQLGVKRARVVMTPITVSGTAPATIVSVADLAGNLCGGVSVGPFAALPNIVGSFNLPGVPTNSCDPMLVRDNAINLADVIVGGVQLGNFLDVVVATQPDIDMDGDGLEHYVVLAGTDCQAVIVSCIDGDGTPIPGRACVTDPRMQDTISAAFQFTAPTTTIVP